MTANFSQFYNLNRNYQPSITTKIFDLRKKGNLSEAFILLKQNLPVDYPDVKLRITDDKWLYIAAANVLIDLIANELSQGTGNSSALDEYCHLISGLELLDGDSTSNRIRFILSRANPYGHLIEQIRKIPKKENCKKAVELYDEYRNQSKDNSYDLDFAWRIYYYIEELLNNNSWLNVDDIKKYLNYYFHLSIPSDNKPVIHKLILICAKRLYSKVQESRSDLFKFHIFLKMWDLSNLTDDYWTSNNNYEPLAISAVVEAVREITKSSSVCNDVVEYYVPYMEKVIRKKTDDIWNYLYMSRLLTKLNRKDEALNNIIKLLKNKPSESWVWNELGLIYDDMNISLACFCRALTCKGDENFKVNIHKNLAELLLRLKDYEHAKTEYMIYFKNKSHVPEKENDIQQEDWFMQTQGSADNSSFYASHADDADKILYESLPFVKAVVGEKRTYFDETKNKNVTDSVLYAQIKSGKIWLNIPSKSVPLEIKVKGNLNLPEEDCKPGTAVLIKGEFDINNKFKVYYIEPDRSSNENDVFREVFGVVNNIDKNSNTAYVCLGRGNSVKIENRNRYTVGTGLKLNIAYYKNKDGNIRFSAVKITDKLDIGELPDYLARRFSGYIKSCFHEIGFADDVMIPPELMRNNGLVKGDLVDGYAYLSFNKKKNSWGYTAAEIERKT